MNELSIREIDLVAGAGDSVPVVTVTGQRWNQDTKDYYDAMQAHNLSGYISMGMLSMFGNVNYSQIYG